MPDFTSKRHCCRRSMLLEKDSRMNLPSVPVGRCWEVIWKSVCYKSGTLTIIFVNICHLVGLTSDFTHYLAPFLSLDALTSWRTEELIRRGLWATIRIEHEHQSNAGRFRSVCWVPPLEHRRPVPDKPKKPLIVALANSDGPILCLGWGHLAIERVMECHSFKRIWFID